MDNLDPTAIADLLTLLVTILGTSHPIVQAIMILTSVIGSASAITKMITKITKITPNTRDDEFATKLERGVSKVVSVVDKVALNPSTKDARRK